MLINIKQDGSFYFHRNYRTNNSDDKEFLRQKQELHELILNVFKETRPLLVEDIYKFENLHKEKFLEFKRFVETNRFNEAQNLLARLVTKVFNSEPDSYNKSSLTIEDRHQLIFRNILPQPHESRYEEHFLKFCCSDQNYHQQGRFKERLRTCIECEFVDDSLHQEIYKHSDLYACYHNKVFSRQIEHLRQHNEEEISTINTEMPIFIFNEVLSDGFGDFAIALSLLKCYRKRCVNPIHLVIVAEPDHIAKIQRVFKQVIEQLQTKDAVIIEWHTDSAVFENLIQQNNNQAIFVGASTGYSHFREGSQVDCLHEMSVLPPFDDSNAHTRNEYSSQRLALKLGFSSTSAGVFMPQKSSIPLQQALIATGCLLAIEQSAGLEGASLEQILQHHDLTIRYMQDPASIERYHVFLSAYAQASGKTIHLLIPTDDAARLANPIEAIAPSVIGHYCPLLPSEIFQALVQQATVPPGVTGNDTFLQALTGEIPWFYDARVGLLFDVIQEFVKYTSSLPVHPITRKYLDFMERASLSDSPQLPSEGEVLSIASEMVAHKTEIREDLQRICQYLIEQCNADVLMGNRLLELFTREENSV